MNKYAAILLISLFCGVAPRANCQVIIALLFGEKLNSDKLEFGLAGGLNQSHISNFPNASSKSGFNLGLYLDFKLNQTWYLRVEAVPKFPTGVSKLKTYSLQNQSLDSLFSNGEVTRKIKNIGLPVLVRYATKIGLYVETGPQLNCERRPGIYLNQAI